MVWTSMMQVNVTVKVDRYKLYVMVWAEESCRPIWADQQLTKYGQDFLKILPRKSKNPTRQYIDEIQNEKK